MVDQIIHTLMTIFITPIEQEEPLKEMMPYPLSGPMNNPMYVLQVKGKYCSCLGAQLLDILNQIDPNDWIWYGADIDSEKLPSAIQQFRGWTPKKVGSIDDLKKIAREIHQFLSGVFFALNQDVGETWDNEVSTEDKPFRKIENAVVEIRAFDTSYFEVYSNDLNVLKKIQTNQGGVISMQGK